MEIANVVSMGEINCVKKLNLHVTSLKSANFMMEAVGYERWGQLLNLPEKRDKYGLRYKPPMGEKEVINPYADKIPIRRI